MARSGHVAVTLVAFLCITSIVAVSGALRASVTPVNLVEQRLQYQWQNPQVFTQKCPGDADYYSTQPKKFWNLYKKYSDPRHVYVNQFGNYSEMTLDQRAAAVFGSYNQYFTGRFSIKLKLPCGNSSGTVFAFYTSSDGDKSDHDEIDIEFLGNETNCPITMQTNVFVNGVGHREMRHNLWFNPCDRFHEYYIQWNSQMVLIGVDSVPIRVFMNNERHGLPFFNKGQGMWLSFWDGSKWATQGGRIKIDYALNAPWVAKVKGFGQSVQGCRVRHERNIWACKYPGSTPFCWENPQHHYLTGNQKNLLRWVDREHCVYDYCKDDERWIRDNMEKPRECDLIPF